MSTMKPAAITAAIVSLGWLIWRIATADCCPHPDLGDDEEMKHEDYCCANHEGCTDQDCCCGAYWESV